VLVFYFPVGDAFVQKGRFPLFLFDAHSSCPYIGPVYLFFDSHLDGVTVAKAITLKDKFENLGAR
jgi:hypothetical protein